MGRYISRNGFRKETDPQSVQPSVHFQVMRAMQHAQQKRGYEALVRFSHTHDQTTYPEGRAGHRLAPVAVFLDKQQRPTALPLRSLHRMYRLAKFDAKAEARFMSTPGPASNFLEIAKRPYEQMMAQVHKKAEPALS